MSFSWQEYLKLAERLNSDTDESCYRSSISTAYYSAFCLARTKTIYNRSKSPDVHSKVIEELSLSANSKEKTAGQLLKELRRLRNNSDYDGDIKIKQHEAAYGCHLAKKILGLLQFTY